MSIINPTAPGVYINELPSSVHSIVGVPTSYTGFVGYAARGPLDQVLEVTSWAGYQQTYGGLDPNSPMSYAIYLFFQNGGSVAQVVRCGTGSATTDPKPAKIALSADIVLEAASPGTWGNNLHVVVDSNNLVNKSLFNLTISDTSSPASVAEYYAGVSVAGGPSPIATRLLQSQLVTLVPGAAATAPSAGTYTSAGLQPAAAGGAAAGGAAAGGAAAGGAAAGGAAAGGAAAGGAAAGGAQAGGGAAAEQAAPAGPAGSTAGTDITATQIKVLGDLSTTGIYALAQADIFNILCLPTWPTGTYTSDILSEAAQFCYKHRAMLIVDPPSTWGPNLQFETVVDDAAITGTYLPYAAVYYPNLSLNDPLTGSPLQLGPSGAVAGMWATTDQSRGVWKAPAGTATALNAITGQTIALDDDDSGRLNPLAVNCIRTLPLTGTVLWGARTAAGSDETGSQWKYTSVRRLALFIEESLYRGTQWVVFEPNAEPLWAAIRLNVGAFMQTLFGQGAFAGTTPTQAYLVKCDSDTNPPAQIANGIVNILVGFAPLYPAEFVFINIEQLTLSAS